MKLRGFGKCCGIGGFVDSTMVPRVPHPASLCQQGFQGSDNGRKRGDGMLSAKSFLRIRERFGLTLTFLTFAHFWRDVSPCYFLLHAGPENPISHVGGTTRHVGKTISHVRKSVIGDVSSENGLSDTKKGRLKPSFALSLYKDNKIFREKQIVLKPKTVENTEACRPVSGESVPLAPEVVPRAEERRADGLFRVVEHQPQVAAQVRQVSVGHEPYFVHPNKKE